MATYQISRYPRQHQLREGPTVTLRPMTAADGPALLAFFRRIPETDRYFLKSDIASEHVVNGFVKALDYDRALPLLAFDGDRIVGDAVLIRHRGGHRRLEGECRLLVDPDYRGMGLGVAFIQELADIAWDAELEFLTFEFIRGIHDDAIAAAEFVGAFSVGTISEFARDEAGTLHDLVYLRIPLGKWWQWSRF
jgi:GNAT superfamily N-acetyltransferase